MLGHVCGQLGWTPWGEGFLLLLVIWLIPIHTRIIQPLVVGHSGGREYKKYYLGGLCYIGKTLHMCTTPKQHCSTSLLGYIAELLGEKVGLNSKVA